MKKLIAAGILTSYRPKADGSFSITISTNELTALQKVELDSLFMKYIYVLLKDTEIDEADNQLFDSIDLELSNGKTPSQRLRSTLFILYNQDSLGYKEFKDYYIFRMEKIINYYKNKIDE